MKKIKTDLFRPQFFLTAKALKQYDDGSGALGPSTPGSSGIDLRYVDLSAETDSEADNLLPHQRKLYPTGLRIALPVGMEAQIRPRSGLAYKKGVTVLNSPGTVDSDYRGEVMVLLVNLSSKPAKIEPGERIAQLVITPIITPNTTTGVLTMEDKEGECGPMTRVLTREDWASLDQNLSTDRGSGGFGSTGTE